MKRAVASLVITLITTHVATARECSSAASHNDRFTINLSSSGHEIELTDHTNQESKTIFQWHEAPCEEFHGWSSDDKYFYFSIDAPLKSSFVLVDQKEVRPVDLHWWEYNSEGFVVPKPYEYSFSSEVGLMAVSNYPRHEVLAVSSHVDDHYTDSTLMEARTNGTKIQVMDAITGQVWDVAHSTQAFATDLHWTKEGELEFQFEGTGQRVPLGEIRSALSSQPENEFSKQLYGEVLAPFPSSTESLFINNQYLWRDDAPPFKIHRIDLIRRRKETISEGFSFTVSADGARMMIDRGVELVYKDLILGKEVILDPLEKINNKPTQNWLQEAQARQYEWSGWNRSENRFWYYRKIPVMKPISVLINNTQVVLTNVSPEASDHRFLSLDHGWLLEVRHIKRDEPGFFETNKDDEYVLTIMALVSGQIAEAARSSSPAFDPKFVKEGSKEFLEAIVEGETQRFTLPALQAKVDAAFNKEDTFTKSAILKKIK